MIATHEVIPGSRRTVKHLYIVTHTQSRHHVEKLVGGWYDSELTELGPSQAARVGQRIRELVPEDEEVELYPVQAHIRLSSHMGVR